MKYFIYTIIILAVGLIGYNSTHIDTNNILNEDSKIALIGIFASACVIILMLILLISKRIQNKK